MKRMSVVAPPATRAMSLSLVYGVWALALVTLLCQAVLASV